MRHILLNVLEMQIQLLRSRLVFVGAYKGGEITTEIEKLTKLESNKFIPYTTPIVAKTKIINP